MSTSGVFAPAAEYLDSLRSDPPENCEYKILSVTEDDDAVAAFYEYQKPDKEMTIAQLFRIREKQIQNVLLVFDGRGFA